MSALKDLFANEKGVFGVLLIVSVAVLTGLGKVTTEQFLDFSKWIFTAYAGATALHYGLAGKPQRDPQPLARPSTPPPIPPAQ